ncbi:hypothetical protein BJ912DRAFT_228125 [Pholiota molesta]|nr:hypothetical protein BJ912DRAFT_228125 [Pholiota molesta]
MCESVCSRWCIMSCLPRVFSAWRGWRREGFLCQMHKLCLLFLLCVFSFLLFLVVWVGIPALWASSTRACPPARRRLRACMLPLAPRISAGLSPAHARCAMRCGGSMGCVNPIWCSRWRGACHGLRLGALGAVHGGFWFCLDVPVNIQNASYPARDPGPSSTRPAYPAMFALRSFISV